VVGTRTVIKSGVTIEDSYLAGADYYESADALNENRERGLTDVGIGGDTVIRRAIVDKNARIGYGVRIDPGERCSNLDGNGYAVREGIVIVEKDAVIPDGSVIPERR
jgi:glucose-1-phosphate adenylyltransferase